MFFRTVISLTTPSLITCILDTFTCVIDTRGAGGAGVDAASIVLEFGINVEVDGDGGGNHGLPVKTQIIGIHAHTRDDSPQKRRKWMDEMP